MRINERKLVKILPDNPAKDKLTAAAVVGPFALSSRGPRLRAVAIQLDCFVVPASRGSSQ
jgi:hypothetical protein